MSPFQHLPAVPAVAFDVAPALVLTAVAAALAGPGLAAFRARDVT